MKLNLSPVLLAATLAFPAAFNLHAQDAAIPSDVKTFAAQYVAAFNARNMAALQALNLPQSRACITPANKDVYEEMLSMQARDPIPPGYKLSLSPVNEGNLKALAQQAYFPVKPERELHIDYQYPETNDGGLVELWLVRQNGRWVGDYPCMTASAIQDYRKNAPAREHYRTIAAAIKDPLRSELLAMLRKHQTGEAETRYRQVTASDMRTAVLVINALQADDR